MDYTQYRALYDYPTKYDKTFSGSSSKKDEIHFYSNYVRQAKEVLYLGTGSGRLLKEFLPIQKNITGVEISKRMVACTKKAFPKCHIIHQNALTLKVEKKFDLIIAPYRFLCHFDRKDADVLFGVVKKHLTKGGIFVGDIFSPYIPHDRSIHCEIEEINIESSEVEKVYNCYDHEKQLCIEIVEKLNTKTNKHTYVKMPFYYFYPEDLRVLAKKNNLEVSNIYGSFQKESLNKHKPDLIFEITK